MFRLVVAALLLIPALAAAAPGAERTLHLLSYIGVDYPNTISDGQVVDQGEYAEQAEFSRAVTELLQNLPKKSQSQTLLSQSQALSKAIAAKAPGDEVKAQTQALSQAIIDAYNLELTPRKPPQPELAKARFVETCAVCHGVQGFGDGPAAKGLDPTPANFHDAKRLNEQSLFGLYNTITLGVQGTAMGSYAKALTDDERWDLATYIAGFTSQMPAAGAKGFSLKELATLTPAQVAARGQNAALFSSLRAHPNRLSTPSPLSFALTTLDNSWHQAQQGQLEVAYNLAISAYLEGFELVEASLDNIDKTQRLNTEKAMFSYRDALRAKATLPELQTTYQSAKQQLETSQQVLNGQQLSPLLSFISSLVILLREGLEAILVLAAILAFLNRAGARHTLYYVHGGWLGALIAGFATWYLASRFIDISGASRELTEGFTALAATAILLWVGIWMHSKSHAANWVSYIREKLSANLGNGHNWSFALLAFMAVYREIFEVILFYQALWLQAGSQGQSAVLWGILVATLLLIVLSVAIIKASMRIPVGRFFAFNAVIMYCLAVIFTGRGVAALQETGTLPAHPLPLPELSWLGFYADAISLSSQALVITFILLSVWRQRPKPVTPI